MFNLTDFEFALVTHFAVFAVTLAFSTKIKDFFNGVPADLRSDLSTIETSIKADVSGYQKSLVAKVVPAPAPVVKAPVAPVVVPPAAPAA